MSDENGHRIFNIDESGFPLAGSNSRLKVITTRGTKNIYKVAPDSRTQITVLSYVAASGGFVNPLVIYPGSQPKFNLNSARADDYSLGKSPNGWINSEVFFTWLSSVFYNEIKDTVEFPILIFLDGHTAHINIAVSDFCRDHDIILFFFPAHASHLIQPLDVSVFGPLKKWYNQEVNSFSRKYNGLQITKNQFFTIFDPAWQQCVSSPQNPISGFKKTGLVPFNPNALDYASLYNPTAAIKEYEEKSSSKSSAGEKLGVNRCFSAFKNILTEEDLSTFENRYDEKYDIVDNTAKNKLWRTYKLMRELDEGTRSEDKDKEKKRSDDKDEGRTRSEEKDDRSARSEDNDKGKTRSEDKDEGRTSCEDSEDNDSIHSITVSFEANDLELENQVRPSPIASTPIQERPSTSTCNGENNAKKSYEGWGFSPFKKYFKISSDIIIKRPASKRNNQVPYAVTSKDFNKSLRKKQELKAADEKRKSERKAEREKKRIEKAAGVNKKKPVKRRIIVTSDESSDSNLSDPDDIILNDSTSSSEDEENNCKKCGKSDGQDVDDAWMGCNRCKNWYHKVCMGERFCIMSNDDLEQYNFICPSCSK